MIGRVGGAVGAGLILLLTAVSGAGAEPGPGRMLSYTVRADVRPDGTVAVVERIRYHFDSARHGIFRFIPLYYPLVHPDGTEDGHDARKLEIDDYRAEQDGRAAPFVRDTTAAGAAENFVLRVGDEHREITGDHDYQLSYVIHGLLNAPGGTAELFWNALGAASEVPVDHADVTVTAPGPIGRVRCVVGGTTPCATAAANGGSARFSTGRLDPHTGMTVTVALPATVAVPAPIVRAKPEYAGGIRDNVLHPGREAGIPMLGLVITVLGFVLGAGLLGLVYAGTRDRYFTELATGEVPRRRSTAPQRRRLIPPRMPPEVRETPPKDVPPALCDVIMNKRAGRSAVASVLISLAVRGHLTIAEREDGHRLTPRPAARDGLATYERRIIAALPAKGITLSQSALDGHAPLRLALGTLRSALLRDAVDRGWFTRNPRRNLFRPVGAILIFLSMWSLGELAERGLLLWWVPFALTVTAVAAVPGRWLTGRTATGSAVLTQALGFRRYLETVDPEGLAESRRRTVFNRYLPYANTFDLTDLWFRKWMVLAMPFVLGWYQTDAGAPFSLNGFQSFASAADSSAASLSAATSTGASSGWSAGDSGFAGGHAGAGDSGGSGGGGGGVGSW